MKRLILIFFSMFIFTSCDSNNSSLISNKKVCYNVNCSNHGACMEAGNDSICLCNLGYHADKLTCVKDVNECEEEIDDCSRNAECIDTESAYNCVCKKGYLGDGISCPSFDFVYQWGDITSNVGNSIKVNKEGGYLYVAGVTSKELDERASPFLSKFEIGSDFSKSKKELINLNNEDIKLYDLKSLSLDSQSNVYAVGNTNDFQSQLIKYNSTDEFIGLENISYSNTNSSTDGATSTLSLIIKPNNNIFLTGVYTDSVGGNPSFYSFFVEYLDLGSKVNWEVDKVYDKAEPSNEDMPIEDLMVVSAVIDSQGYSYLLGNQKKKYNDSENYYTQFVLTIYDDKGKWLVSREFPYKNKNGDIIGDIEVTSMAIDGSNNIYITGSLRINGGNSDVFLSKMNKTTDISKIVVWGDESLGDKGNDIFIDQDNNIYVTGYTDGDIGENKNIGSRDIFLTKFNNNFDFLEENTSYWIRQIGTEKDDIANSVFVDNDNDIWITGSTSGAFENMINSGDEDCFIIKIKQ